MREILFRGKRIDNDEWVEGIPITNKLGTFICYEKNPHYCSQYFYMEIHDIAPVIPETVGQCVGNMTDKNGKKIFEGDILDYFGVSYVVSWSKELLTYIVTSVNKKKDYLFYLNKDNMDEVYVVGNVHDNIELLEEAEK